MAYIGKPPITGNFQVCDAISVVNGQAAYTMQVDSANVSPESANHMLVSLNGVLQKPNSSFTISGSTITFASNLATGDVIDFILLPDNELLEILYKIALQQTVTKCVKKALKIHFPHHIVLQNTESIN